MPASSDSLSHPGLCSRVVMPSFLAVVSGSTEATQRASVTKPAFKLNGDAGADASSPLPSALNFKWGWNLEAGLDDGGSDLDEQAHIQTGSQSSSSHTSAMSDSSDPSFGGVLTGASRNAPVSRLCPAVTVSLGHGSVCMLMLIQACAVWQMPTQEKEKEDDETLDKKYTRVQVRRQCCGLE